jgi:tetratricopeptide (TPR) repeat protein
MRHTALSLTLLMVACFGLAAGLAPWFERWEGNRDRAGDLLAVAMGDGRKLFARHVYAKADAYFHSGYYPSIFDYQRGFDRDNLGEKLGRETASGAGPECATEFLGEPRDWIGRFSRNFYPSRHVHLGEEQSGHVHDENCGHDHEGHVHDEQCEHDHEPGLGAGEKPPAALKEILPWVRLSASLDPEHVDTYLVGAYWLRREMENPREAERFLREGLRALPRHPGLLFELGRIHYEDYQDGGQARNLWELAMKEWRARQSGVPRPDVDAFLYEQIVGNLARLEESQQKWSRALELLEILKPLSPHPDHIQKWMDEIREHGP